MIWEYTYLYTQLYNFVLHLQKSEERNKNKRICSNYFINKWWWPSLLIILLHNTQNELMKKKKSSKDTQKNKKIILNDNTWCLKNEISQITTMVLHVLFKIGIPLC